MYKMLASNKLSHWDDSTFTRCNWDKTLYDWYMFMRNSFAKARR